MSGRAKSFSPSPSPLLLLPSRLLPCYPDVLFLSLFPVFRALSGVHIGPFPSSFFVLNSVSLFLSVLICREFPPCCLPYLYRYVSQPCFPVALFRRVACRTFIVVFPCRTFIVVFPSRAFPPFCLSYFYRCVSLPCTPAVLSRRAFMYPDAHALPSRWAVPVEVVASRGVWAWSPDPAD